MQKIYVQSDIEHNEVLGDSHLSDNYLQFYGDIMDILLGCNTLPIAVERIKELIKQYEK